MAAATVARRVPRPRHPTLDHGGMSRKSSEGDKVADTTTNGDQCRDISKRVMTVPVWRHRVPSRLRRSHCWGADDLCGTDGTCAVLQASAGVRQPL